MKGLVGLRERPKERRQSFFYRAALPLFNEPGFKNPFMNEPDSNDPEFWKW
jgi:hypothetical protein